MREAKDILISQEHAKEMYQMLIHLQDQMSDGKVMRVQAQGINSLLDRIEMPQEKYTDPKFIAKAISLGNNSRLTNALAKDLCIILPKTTKDDMVCWMRIVEESKLTAIKNASKYGSSL